MQEFSTFEELLENSKPMLYAITSTFPTHHREDLFQEGILGLHNAYLSFDESYGVPFKVYLRICVTNSILSAYKKLRKGDFNESFDEAAFDGGRMTMEEKIINKNDEKELFERLKKSLSSLEKKILSEYLKDKTYEEIAKTLSVTEKSVDNALSRIKKKLKDLI